MDDNKKIEILKEAWKRIMDNRKESYQLLKIIAKEKDVGPGTKYYEEYKTIPFKDWLKELVESEDKQFFDSFS